MKLSLVLLGASSIAAVGAVPRPDPHVVHERRSDLPGAWGQGERLEKDTLLPVRIGLTQSNLEYADSLLMEV